MTIFYRPIKIWGTRPGFAISTETTDECQYFGDTIEEVIKVFTKNTGIVPTELVELKN